MHRARAFFYVCAGMFLLALSYHLGARNATAQVVSFRSLGDRYVEVGGQVFLLSVAPPAWHQLPSAEVGTSLPPVPVSSLAVANLRERWAITQEGEGWVEETPGSGQWTSLGFIPSLPTPAHSETWGAVKSRYRAAQSQEVRP